MVKWFAFLFGLVLWEFRGAFQTYIFQDDFFLFVSSRALDLFPFKSYGFYRPVGIELFYFLSGLINNLFITRLVVFSVFFTGLIFLYKIILSLTRKATLAFLTIFIYAISFTHVFQLYWLATLQEVAMFCFSALTTYFYLKKRIIISLIFFLLALLSREQGILLPFMLLLLTRNIRRTLIYFLIILPFFVLYIFNYAQVAIRPEYTPSINPRLITNNALWYGLWSLGLPNFFPDFLPSIFSFPTQSLLTAINNTGAWPYLIFWAILAGLFVLTAIVTRSKKILTAGGFCFLSFLIYVLPISMIVHKWMVRLTIPVIFSSFFLAYLIINSKKWLGIALLGFYILYNLLAVPVHENSSTYQYESKISRRVETIIQNNREAIVNSGVIYFSERTRSRNGWEGSQKLKLTLFDQWFINYFLPGSNVRAVYGYEAARPAGSFIIESEQLL